MDTRTAPGLPNIIIRSGRAGAEPFPDADGLTTRGAGGETAEAAEAGALDDGANEPAESWILR